MADQIGFIGLGIMGKPMVRNLVKAGFEVVVHNRSQAAVDELTGESDKVTAGGSPAGVAAAASVVITMLPDSPDVRDVVFGTDGLAESMQSGGLLIDMSTIAPATSIEVHDALAKRGVGALDAPVSGGDKGAIAGTLSIMVGGSQTDFDRAMPYFEAMGKTIVHVGRAGRGSDGQGLQPDRRRPELRCRQRGARPRRAGRGRSRQDRRGALRRAGRQPRDGDARRDDDQHQFAPGFRVNLHRKDLGIAMATAKENSVPLPVTALVSQLYDTAGRDRRRRPRPLCASSPSSRSWPATRSGSRSGATGSPGPRLRLDVVFAVPPRSGVSVPPEVVRPIAAMTRLAASARPRWSSMSATVQIAAIGLAMPLTGDVRRRSVDRLEHAWAAALRVDVGAGGDAHASGQGAAQVGEDVAEQVRSDHDLQRVRPEDEAGRHRVDEPLFGLDIGVFGGNVPEGVVPKDHAVLLGVALGDAGHLAAFARSGQVERVADDPLAADRGKHGGLDRHLVLRAAAREVAAANPGVLAFAVFPDDDPVDRLRGGIAQRTDDAREQFDRPHAGVLVESLADGEAQVPRD